MGAGSRPVVDARDWPVRGQFALCMHGADGPGGVFCQVVRRNDGTERDSLSLSHRLLAKKKRLFLFEEGTPFLFQEDTLVPVWSWAYRIYHISLFYEGENENKWFLTSRGRISSLSYEDKGKETKKIRVFHIASL